MTQAALTDYWDKIAAYLRHALTLFGDPATLAQRLWLTRRDHKLFADYIRPLEDFVRRLIFIAALERAPMTLPLQPERKFRRRLGMPANTGASFDPAKPETWRVSFKLNPERRRPRRHGSAHADGCRRGAGAPNHVSSAPSAERLEALLRAYENRDKLSDTLARKFARDADIATKHIAPRKRRRTRGPAYVALPDLTPLATEAHRRHATRADSS